MCVGGGLVVEAGQPICDFFGAGVVDPLLMLFAFVPVCQDFGLDNIFGGFRVGVLVEDPGYFF